MLLDGARIHRYLRRVLPGDDETAEAYLEGLQLSFTRYVKGQLLLATSVGLAAGFGIWALGWDVIGIWPEGSRYALLFGFWAGITEVIPFVGPFLGAAPPVLLALFNSPSTALWVALVYFVVQQVENHILVPNIIGSSVGVHPLVVIFALLAGAQVGGILGMLAVLPVLAMLKHTLDFYQLRLSRASWVGEDGLALTAQPRAPGALPVERALSSGAVEAGPPTLEGHTAPEVEPPPSAEAQPPQAEAGRVREDGEFGEVGRAGQDGAGEPDAKGPASPLGRRVG
jgi:hypothetical protein